MKITETTQTTETTASPVRLGALQLAYLQEMGVETALLRPFLRHAAAPVIPAAPAASPARSLAAVQDLAKSLRGNVQVMVDQPAEQPASGNQRGNLARRVEVPRTESQTRPQVLLQNAAGARHTGAGRAQPLSEAALQAAPRPAPPARTPNLACQRCVVREKAALLGADSAHAPGWLIVGETSAAAGNGHTLVQGQAGQLLHAMLAAAGMQAVDTIIRLQVSPVLSASASASVPGEPPPSVQDHIKQQAALQRPACILALGRAAAGAVLGVTDSLESLRGKVWSWVDAAGRAVPVVATYPPGWLLTNPQHKKDVWHDLLLARAAQGAPAPL